MSLHYVLTINFTAFFYKRSAVKNGNDFYLCLSFYKYVFLLEKVCLVSTHSFTFVDGENFQK